MITHCPFCKTHLKASVKKIITHNCQCGYYFSTAFDDNNIIFYSFFIIENDKEYHIISYFDNLTRLFVRPKNSAFPFEIILSINTYIPLNDPNQILNQLLKLKIIE